MEKVRALNLVGAGCTRRQRDILAALAGDLDFPILWRRTGWEYAGSKECGRAEVVTATAFIFEMQANRHTDTKPQLIWIEREAGQSDGDRLGGVPRWLRPGGPMHRQRHGQQSNRHCGCSVHWGTAYRTG